MEFVELVFFEIIHAYVIVVVESEAKFRSDPGQSLARGATLFGRDAVFFDQVLRSMDLIVVEYDGHYSFNYQISEIIRS